MTKRKKPSPAPALDFSEERKEVLRLVERVYEESKYLRSRAAELSLFALRIDYSSAIRRLNDALNAINSVANILNK